MQTAIIEYTPSNWYWSAGNRTGVYYSSKSAAYVDETDQGYQDWIAAGNVARVILCDGELAHSLAASGIEGLPVINVEPTAWGGCTAEHKILAAEMAGCRFTWAATPALNGAYQLSGQGWGTLNTTQNYINAYGVLPNNQPMPWPCYTGQVIFQNATEFTTVFQGLNDYLQAFKTWATSGGSAPLWASWTLP